MVKKYYEDWRVCNLKTASPDRDIGIRHPPEDKWFYADKINRKWAGWRMYRMGIFGSRHQYVLCLRESYWDGAKYIELEPVRYRGKQR